MTTPNDALSLLSGLTLALFVLAWLSRQISLRVQGVAYAVTRSPGCAIFAIFLLLFPGIYLHESAHWLTAKVLGLKPSKFRVWPKLQGKNLGMGSVTVKRGTLLQDSLVGLAPLLAGSALITLIGFNIFDSEQVWQSLTEGRLNAGVNAFWQALRTPDGALWAYALFAIANAMMPSASDREPVRPLLLYIGLAILIYLVLGLPLSPLASALVWLAPTLRVLTGAFFFTILLDVAIWVTLYLAELVLGR